MRNAILLSLFLLVVSPCLFAQSVDDFFSQEKMQEDLALFKNIRLEANSGLYKYRTKDQIDSIYNWADNAIKKATTYGDFHNIICQLTDFEGSLHNDTSLPSKFIDVLRNEVSGYFPYPIKYVENNWIINYEKGTVPLGSEIISINDEKIDEVIRNLSKYYTTDGVNTTGKQIGLEVSFSKYYRLYYGLKSQFKIKYQLRGANKIEMVTLNSVSYQNYYKKFNKRYSSPFDYVNYKSWKENETYSYKTISEQTGILAINNFGLGNEKNPKHLRYVAFLDSVFAVIKKNNITNLIVDVRYNGGGSDPNDLVSYSYLTNRNFSENKQAWISFKKIPYLRYNSNFNIPNFIKHIVVGKFNRGFQKEFPKEINGRYYQDATSNDHKIRTPNKNAFNGNVYLLISPRAASAGSLFAAMVGGNKNSIVIGEETMGGYYGHNGHTSLSYILPKSKIEITFDVVNLEQDVPKKDSQLYNRGIIPDHKITQTYNDYLNQEDTQMNFVLDLVKKNVSE